jgi:hypothetical protein
MAELIGLRDLDSGCYQPVEPKERWLFSYWIGDSQVVLTAYGVEFRFMASHVVRANLMQPEWYTMPSLAPAVPDHEDETAIVSNEDWTK